MERPKFLQDVSLPESYFVQPNPYEDLQESDVNLLELSRYAKSIGKRLSDLSKDEINMFKVK